MSSRGLRIDSSATPFANKRGRSWCHDFKAGQRIQSRAHWRRSALRRSFAFFSRVKPSRSLPATLSIGQSCRASLLLIASWNALLRFPTSKTLYQSLNTEHPFLSVRDSTKSMCSVLSGQWEGLHSETVSVLLIANRLRDESEQRSHLCMLSGRRLKFLNTETPPTIE